MTAAELLSNIHFSPVSVVMLISMWGLRHETEVTVPLISVGFGKSYSDLE
jgi:hypothetical protein